MNEFKLYTDLYEFLAVYDPNYSEFTKNQMEIRLKEYGNLIFMPDSATFGDEPQHDYCCYETEKCRDCGMPECKELYLEYYRTKKIERIIK